MQRLSSMVVPQWRKRWRRRPKRDQPQILYWSDRGGFVPARTASCLLHFLTRRVIVSQGHRFEDRSGIRKHLLHRPVKKRKVRTEMAERPDRKPHEVRCYRRLSCIGIAGMLWRFEQGNATADCSKVTFSSAVCNLLDTRLGRVSDAAELRCRRKNQVLLAAWRVGLFIPASSKYTMFYFMLRHIKICTWVVRQFCLLSPPYPCDLSLLYSNNQLKRTGPKLVVHYRDGATKLSFTNAFSWYYTCSWQVFVELDELVSGEWKETARWIKFEEDVEESQVWGKPRVASLSFHSLLELRKTIEKGQCLTRFALTKRSTLSCSRFSCESSLPSKAAKMWCCSRPSRILAR